MGPNTSSSQVCKGSKALPRFFILNFNKYSSSEPNRRPEKQKLFPIWWRYECDGTKYQEPAMPV